MAIRWTARYVATGVSAAGLAMLFEPFFSALLLQVGIDTGHLAPPVIQFLRELLGQAWFQWLIVLVTGIAIGAWFDIFLRSYEDRTNEGRKQLALKLHRAGETFDILRQRLDDPRKTPRYEEIERYANVFNSLELSLKKLGISVPSISYEADPVGYLERMRDYTSRLAPLINDGHIRDARKEGKRLSEKIKATAPEPPPKTHLRYG